jgi:hypothetical protein
VLNCIDIDVAVATQALFDAVGHVLHVSRSSYAVNVAIGNRTCGRLFP